MHLGTPELSPGRRIVSQSRRSRWWWWWWCWKCRAWAQYTVRRRTGTRQGTPRGACASGQRKAAEGWQKQQGETGWNAQAAASNHHGEREGRLPAQSPHCLPAARRPLPTACPLPLPACDAPPCVDPRSTTASANQRRRRLVSARPLPVAPSVAAAHHAQIFETRYCRLHCAPQHLNRSASVRCGSSSCLPAADTPCTRPTALQSTPSATAASVPAHAPREDTRSPCRTHPPWSWPPRAHSPSTPSPRADVASRRVASRQSLPDRRCLERTRPWPTKQSRPRWPRQP